MTFSKFIKAGLAAATIFVAGSAASAAVVFEENFDSYSPVLNWNGGGNWTVSNGTVDLVANNTYSIGCLGNAGNCVDLDGSTSNAGEMMSLGIDLGAGDYTLSFWLRGNDRNSGTDAAQFLLTGLLSDSFSLNGNTPWTEYTYNFSLEQAGTVNVGFAGNGFGVGGGDNIGIILDGIKIASAIPEPATWLMMIMGFGLVGVASRRRSAAVTA